MRLSTIDHYVKSFYSNDKLRSKIFHQTDLTLLKFIIHLQMSFTDQLISKYCKNKFRMTNGVISSEIKPNLSQNARAKLISKLNLKNLELIKLRKQLETDKALMKDQIRLLEKQVQRKNFLLSRLYSGENSIIMNSNKLLESVQKARALMKDISHNLEERNLAFLFKLKEDLDQNLKEVWLGKDKKIKSVVQIQKMGSPVTVENLIKEQKDTPNLPIPKKKGLKNPSELQQQLKSNRFELSCQIVHQTHDLSKIESYLNDLTEVKNTFKKYSASLEDEFQSERPLMSQKAKKIKKSEEKDSQNSKLEALEKENKELMKMALKFNQDNKDNNSKLIEKFQSLIGKKLDKISELEADKEELEKQNKVLSLKTIQLEEIAKKNSDKIDSENDSDNSYEDYKNYENDGEIFVHNILDLNDS